MAAAYSSLGFQKGSSGVPLESYIWELGIELVPDFIHLTFDAYNFYFELCLIPTENPNKPEHTLKPSSPMLCLEYSPKDPHLLMGGCYNGQLALFDTRKGSQPLEVTPVEISHKDPVHKLIFPSSKTGAYSLCVLLHT